MSWEPLTAAHRDPEQWRRRGLTPPDDLDAIVHARLGWLPIDDPTYADFFIDPNTSIRDR